MDFKLSPLYLLAFSEGKILNYEDLGTDTAEQLTCSTSAGLCLYELKKVVNSD